MAYSYSEEEIEAFRQKDMRMSIAGILQALIGSGQFSKEELLDIECMVNLARKYRKMVWNSTAKAEVSAESEVVDEGGVEEEVEESWESIARDAEVVVPTEQQAKVLDTICGKLQKPCPKGGFLHAIHKEFGKYPSKMSSVDKVLKILNN